MSFRMLLVLTIAGVLAAQEAPPRAGVGVIERPLTLRDAITMALSNNVSIEIERADTAAASAAVRGAGGFLDPTFRWLPLAESRNTPAGSVLQGPGGKLSETFQNQNFYFNQRLPWQGSSLALSFENNRQTSTNPFVSLNPLYSSRLALSFTQPLLRNREIDPQRADLLISRRRRDISETELKLQTIDVIASLEQAYWALVAARQASTVAEEAVELARESLARNRRMIDAGILAPVELAASEAELQRRLDNWYAAIGSITEAENTLKTLLTPDPQDPIWNDQLIPTDVQTLEPPLTDDMREMVGRAFRERPEFEVLGTEQEINSVRQRLAANLTKPQVNLVGTYLSTGLAGAARTEDNPFSAGNVFLYDRINRLSEAAGLSPISVPVLGGVPGTLVGGYGDTLTNLFGGRYQSLQGGLQVDFTFRNNTAEANLAQTAIAERRLKLQRTQLQQAIGAQVRNAVQAIQTARQRIQAADAGARAAREKLESETRLFQTGESTNFLVLTRQNELTDARNRLLIANLDLNRAVARLRQALGQTLEAYNLTLK